MRGSRFALLGVVGVFALACSPSGSAGPPDESAHVVAVRAHGEAGSYQFAVTVRSPDRDCDRYANWWEVVRSDGSLAYRRILMHSHAGEQPFTRSGGPVPIGPDETVIVRAHLHPTGYGGAAFRGSVAGGFAPWEPTPEDFAAALAEVEPQPGRCWY
jgi:hypothetical protein